MEQVLQRLMAGETVSGEAMARELGVTRAAVFKQIEQLRALGFEVESVARQGYRLTACPDSLLAPVVRHGLCTRWAGREIVYLPTVDSTNRYARALAQQGAAHGTLVLADEQTAGRGRRGRGWISPAGEGVFMTLILRPQAHPSQVARLSLLTALAVAEGIAAETGLDARIKWPNDIVVGGRKVCGMLLEMNADEQSVHDVVAGIGINVHQTAFAPEIAHTASSLDLLSGKRLSRAALVRAFLTAFERVSDMDEGSMMRAYRERSATLGQRVQVVALGGTYAGTAEAVTDSGALVVLGDDGVRREVLAADVSVRGIMGYV
ncbi:MAG: biotin--[acetyl-CoA-carboxylase] ligase [Candidatus Ventricola sp.]